jgi:hypothetical protein
MPLSLSRKRCRHALVGILRSRPHAGHVELHPGREQAQRRALRCQVRQHGGG